MIKTYPKISEISIRPNPTLSFLYPSCAYSLPRLQTSLITLHLKEIPYLLS